MEKLKRNQMLGLVLSVAVLSCGAVPVIAEDTETVIETETIVSGSMWEDASVMYALDDVYIRETMDSSSRALQVLHRGSAVVVIGETNEKYIVDMAAAPEELESVEEAETEKEEAEAVPVSIGFVSKKYLTQDLKEAEQALDAQSAALAAAAAAQEAAAQAVTEYRVEDNRITVPDCLHIQPMDN